MSEPKLISRCRQDSSSIGTTENLIKNLRITLFLTLFIFIVEIIGGFLTHSLALLSDAGHILGDLFALGLSWAALWVSAFPPNERKTYGYHRVEVLAALVNATLLVFISLWIFHQAIRRLSHPQSVKSIPMLLVALFGLGINLLVLSILKKGSGINLNVKSAFFHVWGDMLASIGVILGGIIITLTGYRIVDPLISIFIGGIIFKGAYSVGKESLDILLEGVPKGVQLDKIESFLKEVPAVKDVHDLHIWTISSSHLALSAHIVVEEQSTHSTKKILDQIKEVLSQNSNITHVTVQFECFCCEDSGPECVITG
jgi:cobalt-zinc-cadmium efflux system protein